MGQSLAKGKSLVTYPNIKAVWTQEFPTGSTRQILLWEDDTLFIGDDEPYSLQKGLLKINRSSEWLNSLLESGKAKGVSDFQKDPDFIKPGFSIDVNKSKFRPFLFWNLVAAFFHLMNALASFAANPVQITNMYPMYQGFTGWKPKSMFCAASNFTCPYAGKEIQCMSVSGYERGRVDDDSIMAIQPSLTKARYSVSLFWLIVSFHFLSFLFQTCAGLCFRPVYAKHVLNNGVNPLRFLEYSISASLMLLCIALIGSLQDVYAHVGIGVLTAGTMLFGLISEILFSDEFLPEKMLKNEVSAEVVNNEPPTKLFQRVRFNNELGDIGKQNYSGDAGVGLYSISYSPEDDCKGVHVKLRQLGWVAHFAGWVTMLGAYGGIVLNHYFWSEQQARDEFEDFEGPPAWITGLIFAIMSLYMIFGFTQTFQLCAKDPNFQTFKGERPIGGFGKSCFCLQQNNSGDGKQIKCRVCCKCCECRGRTGCTLFTLNEGVELFYVLNSLVTKSILGWVIISQLLVLDFEVTDTIDCK